jgi:hypothetical protein
MFKRLGWVLLALVVVAIPVVADASGGSGSGGGGGSGSGGGGGSGGITLRVVGYCTAIDYTNGTILVGQLYYGSGAFPVNDSTKVTINNVTATFNDVQLGDFCEVRYDSITRVATKIAVTR